MIPCQAVPVSDTIVGLNGERVLVLHGDSGAVRLSPNSIDSIVTDPPGGIGFMGKDWDDDKGGAEHWIAWLAKTLAPWFDALKPGGHALVWAIPRTSDWTMAALRLCGFEIRDQIHDLFDADTLAHNFVDALDAEQRHAFLRLLESQASPILYHLFGTGFPKSLDVSKAIDQAGGVSPAAQAALLQRKRIEAGLTRNDVAEAVGCTEASVRDWEEGRARTHGGCLEYITPSPDYRARLADLLGYTQDERVVRAAAPDRRSDGSVYGLGHAGSMREGGNTDAAATWKGWGTALKPAAEHWILCRKPVDGTVAANVIKHSTGGLNIDACRIGTEGEEEGGGAGSPKQSSGMLNITDATQDKFVQNELGRWPAHVTLDEHTAALLDEQSGKLTSGGGDKGSKEAGGGLNGTSTFSMRARAGEKVHTPNSGGASRFYYIAKAPRREKDAGLDHLPKAQRSEATDREEGSAGRTGGARNSHPTVKSIALMEWLIKLVTPPGGVVADPFGGSGTTAVAAIGIGMRAITCELTDDYVPILLGRITRALRIYDREDRQASLPLLQHHE